MNLLGPLLEGVLEEEDHYRLKMGRFRDGDEREMKRLIERDWSPSLLKRLLGGGVDLGRVGYFSSRPRMPRGGTTFSFNHRWVAKRHEVPLSKDRVHFHLGDAAAARAVGARWDRTVKADGRAGSWWVKSGGQLPSGVRPAYRVEARSTGLVLGAAAAHQSYVERDGAAVLSVGNLGESLEERRAFWGAVEDMERAGGRVQGRIIAELPWEPLVGDDGRRRVVEEFCAELDALGVSWWAAIHKPEAQNDPRNWHVHILLHDRRVERWIDGDEGDVVRRPVFSAKKIPEVQERGFVEKLRVRWSECVNRSFERAGLSRRFDPRSYAAAGVAKRPGVHMGSAAMGLERRGVATTRGSAAVGIEMEARIAASAAGLGRLAEADRERIARGVLLVKGAGSGGAVAAAAASLAEAGRRLAEAGRVVRRAQAVADIAEWVSADRPRRLAMVARKGSAEMREVVSGIGRRMRDLGRVQVRGARRRLSEARSGYAEALAAFEGIERRMVAERLIQDLRRAREGLALLEAGVGGRVTIEEWRGGVQAAMEHRRRAAEELAVAREATRRHLTEKFGESGRQLVELALDPRRRCEVVQVLDDEIGGGGTDALLGAREALRSLSAAEISHASAQADVARRERMEGSPGAMSKVVVSRSEAEAIKLAREKVSEAEAAIAGNVLATDAASRRGLVRERPVARRGARDHPLG